ncbi:hypothetical protein HDV00_012712 [Rhizophlyctis rosea]|nr:hypothetical protein HDV00_012712 [Rhizophlyctis rosea]
MSAPPDAVSTSPAPPSSPDIIQTYAVNSFEFSAPPPPPVKAPKRKRGYVGRGMFFSQEGAEDVVAPAPKRRQGAQHTRKKSRRLESQQRPRTTARQMTFAYDTMDPTVIKATAASARILILPSGAQSVTHVRVNLKRYERKDLVDFVFYYYEEPTLSRETAALTLFEFWQRHNGFQGIIAIGDAPLGGSKQCPQQNTACGPGQNSGCNDATDAFGAADGGPAYVGGGEDESFNGGSGGTSGLVSDGKTKPKSPPRSATPALADALSIIDMPICVVVSAVPTEQEQMYLDLVNEPLIIEAENRQFPTDNATATVLVNWVQNQFDGSTVFPQDPEHVPSPEARWRRESEKTEDDMRVVEEDDDDDLSNLCFE